MRQKMLLLQEYTSKETSIKTLNKVYKDIVGKYPYRASILDYGCGKYDVNQKFAEENKYVWFGYDPFNRNDKENRKSISKFDYDLIVCNNVLNVIKENIVIDYILQDIYARATGDVFFTIYEGDKSGCGKPTSKGYQRNEKTNAYMSMIGKHFDIVSKKGNIIHCNVKIRKVG